MTDEMVRYYALRAGEYERVYQQQPRWQADLVVLRERIAALFAGRRVFEVACGTAHGPRRARDRHQRGGAGHRAQPAVAVRSRSAAPPRRLRTERGGAAFDAGLAALWLSHVDRARMAGFLEAFHSHLVPGARVFMFDERDAPERPLPASRLDAANNRYEMRRLASGERFEIVKNFYDESQLRRLVGPYADDVEVQTLTCFWTLAYATRGPRRQRPSKSRYGHRRSSSRVRSPSSRRSESRRWSSRRP